MANENDHLKDFVRNGLVLSNFIVRFNDQFYRVRTSVFKIKLLRKYAQQHEIPFAVYYSKKKGMSYGELLDLLGLKLNSGIFVKVAPQADYIDAEAKAVQTKAFVITAIVAALLTGLLFLAI